jgi:hypothetical protein
MARGVVDAPVDTFALFLWIWREPFPLTISPPTPTSSVSQGPSPNTGPISTSVHPSQAQICHDVSVVFFAIFITVRSGGVISWVGGGGGGGVGQIGYVLLIQRGIRPERRVTQRWNAERISIFEWSHLHLVYKYATVIVALCSYNYIMSPYVMSSYVTSLYNMISSVTSRLV